MIHAFKKNIYKHNISNIFLKQTFNFCQFLLFKIKNTKMENHMPHRESLFHVQEWLIYRNTF